MSGPVVKDGAALRRYLVRLAMEAFDGTMGGRLAIETALHERMAQAAQTIVCEVAAIERDTRASALLYAAEMCDASTVNGDVDCGIADTLRAVAS